MTTEREGRGAVVELRPVALGEVNEATFRLEERSSPDLATDPSGFPPALSRPAICQNPQIRPSPGSQLGGSGAQGLLATSDPAGAGPDYSRAA
jgi:hypothetical protein